MRNMFFIKSCKIPKRAMTVSFPKNDEERNRWIDTMPKSIKFRLVVIFGGTNCRPSNVRPSVENNA